MFFYNTDNHSVPHVHAEFQGDVGVYSIPDGDLLSGKLPPKNLKAAPPDIAQQVNKADPTTSRRAPRNVTSP